MTTKEYPYRTGSSRIRRWIVATGLSLLSLAAAASGADRLALELYPAILSGQAEKYQAAFRDEPRIDTPRTGPLRGPLAWKRFLVQEAQWLKELGVSAPK